jgi:hypothetical protein
LTTKIEFINGAYSLIRISGITVDPSGGDITLALERLEDMAAEFHGRNMFTDYNFEENPNADSLHNVKRKYWFAFKANLAVRVLPDFGKQPDPILLSQQQSSYSFLAADTALVKEIPYPRRMPVGERNSLRLQNWNRYYNTSVEAPLSSDTIVMYIDDIKAFSESFIAYLDFGETIASYTIEADGGLTIVSDTNASPLITYVIQADGLSDGGSVDLLQVKIVITTSESRVQTRIINFKLLDSEIRGV